MTFSLKNHSCGEQYEATVRADERAKVLQEARDGLERLVETRMMKSEDAGEVVATSDLEAFSDYQLGGIAAERTEGA